MWKVIWLKSIGKMDILTFPDYFHVAERMEFWYLYSLSKKEKGNYEKLDFIYVAVDKKIAKKKSKKKVWFFCNFFVIFHNFPFNFGKINIDIKIPFLRPHEKN